MNRNLVDDDNLNNKFLKLITQGNLTKIKDFFYSNIEKNSKICELAYLKFLYIAIKNGNLNIISFILDNIYTINNKQAFLQVFNLSITSGLEKVTLKLIKKSDTIKLTYKEFAKVMIIALNNDSYLSARIINEYFSKHSDALTILKKLLSKLIANNNVTLCMKLITIGVPLSKNDLINLNKILNTHKYDLNELTDLSFKILLKAFKKDLSYNFPNNHINLNLLESKLNKTKNIYIKRDIDRFIIILKLKKSLDYLLTIYLPSNKTPLSFQHKIPTIGINDIDNVILKISRQVSSMITKRSIF